MMDFISRGARILAAGCSLLLLGQALSAGASVLEEIDPRFVMSYRDCSPSLTASARESAISIANCDGRVVVATSSADLNPFATFDPVAKHAWQEADARSTVWWALAYCKPDGDTIRLAFGILRSRSMAAVRLGVAWYLDDENAELIEFDGVGVPCNPILRVGVGFGPRIACFAAFGCRAGPSVR